MLPLLVNLFLVLGHLQLLVCVFGNICLFLSILHSKIPQVLGQSNTQEVLVHILVQLSF
nr:MAG TPA: hypothetical protein [Caudoviricetes sp.]